MLTNADKAELSLRIVREAKELSYDTETSGLDWKRNFPVGYVIGDGHQTVVYVPVRHGGGGNLPDRNVQTPTSPTDPMVVHSYERELAKAFTARRALPKDKGLIVGHHIKFDAHFSARAGIMLGRNLTDTQNNEALLDEYAKAFSLEACAERWKVTAKKGQELYQHLAMMFDCPATRDSMEHFWRTAGDDPIPVEYAEGDGITTHELFEKQRVELLKPPILGMTDDGVEILGHSLEQIWDIENRLIWTLFRMEHRGIKLDMDYLAQMAEIVKGKIAEAQDKLPKSLNVKSGPQMLQYIEASGRTDYPLTEQGNPSFPEKWLKSFPEGKSVVAVRTWTTLLNSFVTPLIERHAFEGRVHPHINQLKADDAGTVSGRLSCSEPNLQQIPKRNKELAKLFRKLFLPDKGMEFYEADYSQCEPRLFAHYSGDKALVEGYSQTPFKDVHAVVSELLGVERDPTAKRMNMGMFTGMYPPTFSKHMGWDLGKATQAWNAWRDLFPGIKGFQDGAKDVILDRGFVFTLLYRRGRLENPRFAYKGVSKIIQGGNADILKYMMVLLDEECEAEGDLIHLLMSVHDAFEWQAPANKKGRARSEQMMQTMIKVQEPPFNLRIPFAVDFDKGKNWAEASFGPESEWK